MEIGLYRKFDRKTETVLFLALKMANFRLKCTWVSDLVLYLLFWNSGSFRTLVSQIYVLLSFVKLSRLRNLCLESNRILYFGTQIIRKLAKPKQPIKSFYRIALVYVI